MNINRSIGASGELAAKLIRPKRAPISWRFRNAIRIAFIVGWLYNNLARLFSKLTGLPVVTSELSAVLIKANGEIIDYGVVGRRVVTNAGVAFLVDDWDTGATSIADFNYHASGTGNTAEAAGDTALVAESTTITDRATGTKSQPSANQIRSVATQSFTGTGAIVEHGLFSVVTESSGTLWDRTVFTAINVDNLDSIQWTYTATFTAGS